jgi:integrase
MARGRDLPDLAFFMLATGVRIGEALAAVWSEFDFAAGTVQITSTLVRVKGEGLLRKGTKSRAGERTLPLPETAVAMLQRRFMTGARLDQPIFPDVLGGFRDGLVCSPGGGPARAQPAIHDARRLHGQEGGRLPSRGCFGGCVKGSAPREPIPWQNRGQ